MNAFFSIALGLFAPVFLRTLRRKAAFKGLVTTPFIDRALGMTQMKLGRSGTP